MPSRSQILNALQYDAISALSPVNGTGSARHVVSYQFASSGRPGDLPTSKPLSGWTPFNTAEKAAYKKALNHIETFLNVRFVEVSGHFDPDINVGKVNLTSATDGHGGYAITYIGSSILSWDGFTVFDRNVNLASKGEKDLILHEVGHALGLKHPFSGGGTLPHHLENNKYSIMSYTPNPDTGSHGNAMGLYDILALQDIWGAAKYNGGNTVYKGARNVSVDTIWDTGGIDTLNASARKTSVELDLREGAFSTFGKHPNVTIAFGTKIENAVGGAAADKLVGNAMRNVLKGNGGNDILAGREGHDVMNGGFGSDRLHGGTGHDNLSGAAGRDFLYGGRGNDKLAGWAGNDVLTGHGGADQFHFARGGDKDVITDFANNVDTIRFQGLGTKQQVMSKARQKGDDAVFDFGGGDVLTVRDTKVWHLADDIIL